MNSKIFGCMVNREPALSFILKLKIPGIGWIRMSQMGVLRHALFNGFSCDFMDAR